MKKCWLLLNSDEKVSALEPSGREKQEPSECRPRSPCAPGRGRSSRRSASSPHSPECKHFININICELKGLKGFKKGVTKRCRLSYLTNRALV